MASLEPVAIIGTGCRLPGSASSPSKLWDLLHHPRNVASKAPSDRFSHDAFYHPDGHHGTSSSPESYFLTEDIWAFDAPFFNISHAEAESMDPQQRLLLEVVYESLERAGLKMESLRGSNTGVFCGLMNTDYNNIISHDLDEIPTYTSSGTAASMLSNRLSFFFDWRGPSMTIDTACSSSLVALHQGVSALRSGDCRMAVVVASNLILSPREYIASSKMHLLSPTGRCRMWDEDADGYARGEGVASVILKRLSDAIASGDPIECIIRATGINADGRTMGLTIPSSIAQSQLIRSTYASVGLDPQLRPEDRCQFFEAHGTGTQVGDPQEASAIYESLFGHPSLPDDVLYVGSIKTVIGHTEGTAGLASVIKASLSVQQGIIPPNMHFSCINPMIVSFTSRLRVPTQPLPWPNLSSGSPRRVSVNSFGFGGSNAHAIIESYTPPENFNLGHGFSPQILPFTFSAATENSLTNVMERYAEFLQDNPQIDLIKLAESLTKRRSAFRHRVILTAVSSEALQSKIQAELERRKSTSSSSSIVSRANDAPKQVLGIFTGQGAQYPQMFWDSISASPQALVWMAELQESLDTLPSQYRPSFSMTKELSTPKPFSRLHEAAISQPIRTAIQIIQVNMLRALRIEFSAVVGHSSGEIVAAYAANAITAKDAIRIAYLRGLVIEQAIINGPSGAMLAGGIPWKEARALCDEGGFSGKVAVAASNSPVSVTFSGDTDAVQDLEWMLRSLDLTVNRIVVDTAYHSHHMVPCAAPYLRYLESSDTRAYPLSTKWFSSVYKGKQLQIEDINPQYWVENMLRPVLFSQAVTAALADNPDLSLVIEIGPHPTLKGPVLQTLSEIKHIDAEIPYFGLAERGSDSIEVLARAIGLIWAYLEPNIDIQRYLSLFGKSYESHIIKHMPTYPFDKKRSYQFISRLTKARMHRSDPPHPLLGVLSPETGDNEWRWRNYLSRAELEWLHGHRIQSQLVFPATGYIAMALETAAAIARDKSLRLVEIDEMLINRALPIPNDMSGVETIFKVEQISSEDNVVLGAFTCYASFSGVLKTCASGKLTITIGKQDAMLLPPQSLAPLVSRPVDIDNFYASLERLGLGYSGLFRGLQVLTRHTNGSMGMISNSDMTSSLLLHPAIVDSSLQALLAAMVSGQLHTLHVPVSIEHIAINTMFCKHGSVETRNQLVIETLLHDVNPNGATGDISTFDIDGHGVYQIEGFHVAPLTLPEDRAIFSEVVWGPLLPQTIQSDMYEDFELQKDLYLAERCALLYIRDARNCISSEEHKHLDSYRSRIVAWMDRVLSMTSDGIHSICRPEWLEDNMEDILEMSSVSSKDWTSLHIAGRKLVGFITGNTKMTESLCKEEHSDQLYDDPFEIKLKNSQLATFVEQIAFRFPRLKILEIAAGKSSATESILNKLNRSYHSYTFTGISPTSFTEMQTVLSDYEDRLLYQELDINQDPAEQGFKEHSYDLVIAAGTLYITKGLVQTLTNIRRLLKPGGYLVARVGTNTDTNRLALMFGQFENWRYDGAEGRRRSPVMCIKEWERLLEKTGFGGFQAILPAGRLEFDSIIVSQAIDDRIQLLRDPWKSSKILSDRVLLIGGATETTANIMQDLRAFLTPQFDRLVVASSLELLDLQDTFGWCVLSLTDIDTPVYQNLADARFSGLKMLMNNASELLWVTAGPESGQPYWSMSKAMVHCMAYENPQSTFQYLNIPDRREVSAQTLATNFMRLIHTAMENDHSLDTFVNSTELELQLVQGSLKIPRIHMSDSMNQRYSANHRVVKDYVDLQRTILEVVPPSGRHREFALCERVQSENHVEEHHRQLRVYYSTMTALKLDGIGFLHLILGRDTRDKTRWLALCDRHASEIAAPLRWCWQVPDFLCESAEPKFLMKTAASLIALQVINQGRPDTSLLVHGADALSPSIRDALSALVLIRNIRLYFSTSVHSTHPQDDMLFIHERSSSRALSRLLPDDISVVARCQGAECGVYTRIEALFPDAMTIDIASLGRISSSLFKFSDPITAGQTFLTACGVALQLGKSQVVDLLSVQDIFEYAPGSNQLKILDWSHPGQVPVLVQTASSMVSLSAHKTYLLVGMTGDLGQSVCQWMIGRGARAVVLGSRTPSVDPQWIKEMATLGAQVLPMAMDVTNRESICHVRDTICSQMPPIGGVVNGAMVLKDCLFAQTTLEDMKSVLAPKVEGSIFLNEIFGNRDLDFFILFGSAAGPLGNVGQTAYSAATGFMSALIQQRREQGLVGSIIHPGLIKGVGYFARADRTRQDTIEKNTGTPHLTEQDLHELFAEGILAGRPDSGRNPEVIAGYKVIDPAENPNALWLRNPKAWSLVNPSTHSISRVSSSDDSISMKIQLESARSMDGVIEAIAEGFIKEVRSKLQLSDDESLTGAAALTELGVDSLVAIELRQWFVKELSVDIPVLQIIGGSSIRDLSRLAASKLSTEYVPNIDKSGSQQRLVPDS
ncbi:ketoacyl-synt-domain-containing protein [Aspergillus ellipticus CBS 707.79]|uniref:Ketoacyl-synt-domain-containing protein n=1 Tax=Aspergillus ellipticus CBS 707.79 TaxID=1448320 RepID=A0A319E552_9EURO|nr:ketoacyl-synt-domain-containing protein [Aspergillus ellipticus CBS 707.79]